MQIVIDIPETFYKDCKECCELKWGGYYTSRLMNAIKNSTPLPEHHGRLIDISEYEDNYANVMLSYDDGNQIYTRYTNIIPTIVEADKGVLEKINEKQNSLRATCKAWDEAIQKDGYVN